MTFNKVLFCLTLCIVILSNSQPAFAESELNIEVDLWNHSLSVLDQGKIIKNFYVASGKAASPTPIGSFKIVNKAKNWGGGFGTRWMELDVPWGVYGIHGTNLPHLIGKNVSHGCLRMKNKDVEWLYQHISVGTPVDINGPLDGLENDLVLSVGSKGTIVYLIQQRLQLAGVYTGKVNGYFNEQTEQAIKQYQADHHLIVTGHGNRRLYLELGLLE